MEISKPKGSAGSPNFNTYRMEVSFGELKAIAHALEKNHSGSIGDELHQGLRFYMERLPAPGEEETKKGEEKEGKSVADKVGLTPESPGEFNLDDELPAPPEEDVVEHD